MKSFFLALVLFGLPAFAAQARESIDVTCLIHENGKDRLTEQKFILVEGLEQTLFFVNKVRYTALFLTHADWPDERLSAVSITIHDPATKSQSSARTTFLPSVGFTQLRIDAKFGGAPQGDTRGFYLCVGNPLAK